MSDGAGAIDNAAALFGLELQPEWREAAVAHFEALQAAVALFCAFPLDDEADYAAVFTA